MEIELTKGKVTIIDAEDYHLVEGFKWRARLNHVGIWYAEANIPTENGKKKAQGMHRVLMGLTDPRKCVDHKNGDGLDNRRANLRVCTNSQNQYNSASRGGTSVYKGVSWFPRKNKWRVAFMNNRRAHHVGYFRDELEAAKAYNEAIVKVAGEFARLNDV